VRARARATCWYAIARGVGYPVAEGFPGGLEQCDGRGVLPQAAQKLPVPGDVQVRRPGALVGSHGQGDQYARPRAAIRVERLGRQRKVAIQHEVLPQGLRLFVSRYRPVDGVVSLGTASIDAADEIGLADSLQLGLNRTRHFLRHNRIGIGQTVRDGPVSQCVPGGRLEGIRHRRGDLLHPLMRRSCQCCLPFAQAERLGLLERLGQQHVIGVEGAVRRHERRRILVVDLVELLARRRQDEESVGGQHRLLLGRQVGEGLSRLDIADVRPDRVRRDRRRDGHVVVGECSQRRPLKLCAGRQVDALGRSRRIHQYNGDCHTRGHTKANG